VRLVRGVDDDARVVQAPANQLVLVIDGARVLAARGDRSIRASGYVGLPAVIAAPTVHVAFVGERAGVTGPARDRHHLLSLELGRDVEHSSLLPAPTHDLARGRDATAVRFADTDLRWIGGPRAPVFDLVVEHEARQRLLVVYATVTCTAIARRAITFGCKGRGFFFRAADPRASPQRDKQQEPRVT
jgi:hypothetical protein